MKPWEEISMGRAFEVFGTGEINEFVQASYRELSLALREHSDFIELNKSELIHVSNGITIDKLPMIYGNDSIYDVVRRSFLEIFRRDSLVKQYFCLENADSNSLTIKVIR